MELNLLIMRMIVFFYHLQILFLVIEREIYRLLEKKILLENIVYHYIEIQRREEFIFLNLILLESLIGNKLLILVNLCSWKLYVDLLKIDLEVCLL